MTIAQTLKAVKALGLTIRYSAEYKEYRINFRNGCEGSAHYTNNAEDAILTARSMAWVQSNQERTVRHRTHTGPRVTKIGQ
jgi:hypothetical protein